MSDHDTRTQLADASEVVPEGCSVNSFSSRSCGRGTKSCVLDHCACGSTDPGPGGTHDSTCPMFVGYAGPGADDKRVALATAIHDFAFAVSRDARKAARVTDNALAQIDRELTYESVQPHSLHVLGNRSDALVDAIEGRR